MSDGRERSQPALPEEEPLHWRIATEIWAMVMNRLDEGDDVLAEPEDEDRQ